MGLVWSGLVGAGLCVVSLHFTSLHFNLDNEEVGLGWFGSARVLGWIVDRSIGESCWKYGR